MSRADNPKYRRIVPRGRVSIRRQFILKSRGIGRDWSGESGPSSPPAFRVVKYSRRGDPEGFSQPIRGEPKAVEEKEEEREKTVPWVGLSPANRHAFSSLLPVCRGSSHASRVIHSPFALFFPPSVLSVHRQRSPPLSLHGGRRLINEDLHFSISSPRYPSIH